MSGQRLERTLTAFRIGDPDGDYPIWDATGSRLYPGRWNTADTPMIYASEHYSTAMLEKLARGAGAFPPNQHFVEITIDAGVSYEMFSVDRHPGWADTRLDVSRAHGQAWLREGRSAILIVPSVIARMERNILINPDHTEFSRIRAGLHHPVWWDRRLFASQP